MTRVGKPNLELSHSRATLKRKITLDTFWNENPNFQVAEESKLGANATPVEPGEGITPSSLSSWRIRSRRATDDSRWRSSSHPISMQISNYNSNFWTENKYRWKRQKTQHQWIRTKIGALLRNAYYLAPCCQTFRSLIDGSFVLDRRFVNCCDFFYFVSQIDVSNRSIICYWWIGARIFESFLFAGWISYSIYKYISVNWIASISICNDRIHKTNIFHCDFVHHVVFTIQWCPAVKRSKIGKRRESVQETYLLFIHIWLLPCMLLPLTNTCLLVFA